MKLDLRVAQHGVDLVMMMDSAAAPRSSLMAAGYLPVSTGADLFSLFEDPTLQMQAPVGHHLIFT